MADEVNIKKGFVKAVCKAYLVDPIVVRSLGIFDEQSG